MNIQSERAPFIERHHQIYTNQGTKEFCGSLTKTTLATTGIIAVAGGACLVTYGVVTKNVVHFSVGCGIITIGLITLTGMGCLCIVESKKNQAVIQEFHRHQKVHQQLFNQLKTLADRVGSLESQLKNDQKIEPHTDSENPESEHVDDFLNDILTKVDEQ